MPDTIPTPSAPVSALATRSLLGFGELWSQAWSLYKKRLNVLLMAALIPAVANVLVHILLRPDIKANNFDFSAGYFGSLASYTGMGLVVTVLTWIIGVIGSVALIHLLTKETGLTVSEAYRQTFTRISTYLGVSILVGLFVLIGIVLFIVPGIYLAVVYAFALYVAVLEGKGGMNALRTSKGYVAGRWWGVFGRVILMAIIGGILGGIVARIGGSGGSVGNDILSGVWSVAWMPFSVAFTLSLYQSARAGAKPA